VRIEKKKYDPTDVEKYQVVEDEKVIFEGSEMECLDFIFANI